MACNITDGIGRPVCPGETPNAYDTFWLFNTDEVASYSLTGNLITGFTFDSGKGFYQVVAKKGSVVVREEKQDNDTGATDYTHEMDFRLVDLSPTARDWVNDLNGASLGAVVRTKGGRFIVLGYNDGTEMAVNNMSTTAEELGEFITLRETSVSEKTRRYLQTDESTTLAAILAKVVGS